MANTDDLISTLKKEINSILVSAGTEMSLRQLEVDYHDIIRKAIPYREAGHTSLEELVLSMPDAVMTRWWNGELKLSAITNVCNEHVAKLVSLSKNKPKTSYRTNRKSLPRPCQQLMSLPGPYQQPLLSNMTTRNNTVSVKTTNFTIAGSNADYNMLRGEILNLMLGYRYGLLGSKFTEAFAKRYGNYKKLANSGFPSNLALLQSMPDVVDIEFHQNSTDFTVRGKLGQKKTNGSGTNLVDHGRFPLKVNGVANGGSNEQKNHCYNVDVVPEVPGFLGKHVNGEKNRLTEMPYDDEEGSENGNEELNEKVSGDIKSNIQKVLSIHPNGLYASKFMAEYKKVHGTELVVKKLGYQTVIELVAELPEIAVIERPANGDWLVFDKRTYRKELVNQVLQHKGQYLPPTPTLFDFSRSLQMVLEANQDGVQLKDLESIYENSIHQSINPRQLGFQNLDRLLESVSDMAEIEYMGAGRVVVKLVKTLHKMCNGSQKIRNADLSLAPFLPTTRDNLPKDVALDRHFYTMQDPPSPSEEYFEVLVSEVRDPSHFWFQLRRNMPILDRLMDNLQAFYQHPAGKNYVIPSEMLKIGLVCVGQYPENQEWHRCVILELKDEDAKVSYVDYGTEELISKKSLRFITLAFLSALPAQAIGGRLSRIAPFGKSWTPAAFVCFLNLVRDRKLVARITNISKDIPFVVSLCLCDTSGKEDDEDIHINDYLIQEQHAKLCVEEFQENGGVADVEEDVGVAVDEWIVCNDVDDDDEYEFSSSESETEQKVVSSEPAVATTSQLHADKAKETASVSGHLFKFVQLTPEYSFHMINIEEKAYIISSEVSSFFWEEDLIRPLLRNQGKANVSKVVLTEDEHGEILQQLFDAKLPGTSRSGVLSQMVVLYELSSVVEILELFNHPSEELKLAVQQQLDLFNAQDSYWTGKKEPGADSWSSEREQDYFRQAWNDLHKKRECALKQMNTPSCETARLVEEIEDIEEKMTTLKTRFEQLTDKESASVLSFGPSTVPSVDHVISQQDRLDLKQNIAESSSSASWRINSSSNSLGHSSSTSRSLLSTTNEETSHLVVNNSTHLPTTSLPVSSVGVSNLGVNSSSSLSASDQTSLSSSVYSSRNCSQPSSNHDYANMLTPRMSLMSLGGIQTQAPGFAAAVSLPGSGATSHTYSAGYQVPINNGLVSSLPLILNNSFLPSFNPLQYNPVLLGSIPYPPPGPCYIPGPYPVNGLLPTPGLLPSLSIYTRLASGGYPSGLALPNTFFTGNQNLPNMPH